MLVLKANHSLWSNRSVLIDTNLAVAIKPRTFIRRALENLLGNSPMQRH